MPKFCSLFILIAIALPTPSPAVADVVSIDFSSLGSPWGTDASGPITASGISATADGVTFTFDLTVEDNNAAGGTSVEFNGTDVLLRERADNSSAMFTISNISNPAVSFEGWLGASIFDNAGAGGANGPDELTFASSLGGSPSEVFSNPNLTFDATAGTWSGANTYDATFAGTFSAPTLSVAQADDGSAANTRVQDLSVSFSAIPEPSSALAMLCIGCFRFARRRR